MTQLTDVRKAKKIKLPSYPDVEVEILDGLLTSQIGELQAVDNDYERGIKSLEFLIRSWSFVDEHDKPLPANVDNLKKLPMKDFTVLMDAANDAIKIVEEKKGKN